MDNSNQNKFSLRKRAQSFIYAFSGIGYMFRTQHNSWIHLVAVIAVVILGFVLEIGKVEWCLLILAIGLVFTTEMINTSIERVVDLCSPEYNKKAAIAKDVAAGAVLISAIVSVAIGLIVFLPKILA